MLNISLENIARMHQTGHFLSNTNKVTPRKHFLGGGGAI